MSNAPELGSEIGGYRLESVLGKGGMGIVYLARGADGGICALKVLPRRLLGDDPSFATRFKREAQYAEALAHPHVVELYEAGQTPDGTLYFAMQYVEGPDLGVLLRRDGPMSLPQALSILGQIGDALDAAHATGLVHRDVKPGNIIVADDPSGPQAYLTDFGLSKNQSQDSVALTKKGQLIGTMAYTAPEEILASDPRDHRVDIYSLGCVLYEALVGAQPFVRDRDIEVLYAHVGNPRPSATAARPDLPAGIDDVIATAMSIAASERYSSCAELIAAAQALLGGEEASPEARATAAEASRAVAEPADSSTPVTTEPAPEQVSGPRDALVLTVSSGLGHGLALTVEDELVLGRLTLLDHVLAPDFSISRRHARVTRMDDGGYVVHDEHSRNGTFVNGARIDSPHTLRTGDELRIGATVFVAVVTATQAESAAEPPAEWVETPHAQSTTEPPAEWVETPQAESTTEPPAEWVETPQAESTTEPPAEWVETPQAESTTEPPAEWVETPQAESTTEPPAEWVETPQAESTTEPPAEWVETPQAESTTEPPAEWVETPQAESTTEPPAEWVETPQAQSTTEPPAEWVETPQAESTTEPPAEWVETPQAESTTEPPAEWVETPQAQSTTEPPAEWEETPQAESATEPPAEWEETPQAESATEPPAAWVETPHVQSTTEPPAEWEETPRAESAIERPAQSAEAPQAESTIEPPPDRVETPHAQSTTEPPAQSAEAPRAESTIEPPPDRVETPPARTTEPPASTTEPPTVRVEAPRVGELVVEAGGPETGLTLRLEFDLDAGELIVGIENGATVRLVRDGDEWYVESS